MILKINSDNIQEFLKDLDERTTKNLILRKYNEAYAAIVKLVAWACNMETQERDMDKWIDTVVEFYNLCDRLSIDINSVEPKYLSDNIILETNVEYREIYPPINIRDFCNKYNVKKIIKDIFEYIRTYVTDLNDNDFKRMIVFDSVL